MDRLDKIELLREYVSSKVREGFIRGFHPDWDIEYSGIHQTEISDYALKHIADAIREGYWAGEILDDTKRGWWKLNLPEIYKDDF